MGVIIIRIEDKKTVTTDTMVTREKTNASDEAVTVATPVTKPKRICRCKQLNRTFPDFTASQEDDMLRESASPVSSADVSVQEQMAAMQDQMKAIQGQMAFICQAMGRLLPFDNTKTDISGHIEGSTDDMRHKVLLPTGKWVSANSTQQLAESVWAAAKQQQPQKESPLMEEYILRWFDTYKRPALRGTTCKSYWSGISRHIIPYFQGRRIAEIKTADIQAFLTEKNSYARSTLHTLKVILQEIFDSAIEDEYISKNPAGSKRITMSDKVTEREEVKPEHVREIVGFLKELKQSEKLFLAILIYTGARRGEALALRWEDVDFKEGIIHITKAITYADENGNKPVVGKTKSKAGVRDVPLFPELREIMTSVRQLSGFIVNRGDAEKPLTQSAFSRAWERISKAIPVISREAYSPHQFRHAFLTSASAAGLDPKTLQTIAGHSDIRITMNRYVHSRADRVKAAGNICNGMYLEHEASA